MVHNEMLTQKLQITNTDFYDQKSKEFAEEFLYRLKNNEFDDPRFITRQSYDFTTIQQIIVK